MMKRIFRYLIIVAAVILTSACYRRPLEEASSAVKIRVSVNIKAIANVTTNVYNEKIPVPDLSTDMMRVMVYDPDTKNLLTQSFISNKSIDTDGNQTLSGDLSIGAGNYDFVVYNFDTPTTLVRDENNEMTITAYTSEISSALKAKFATKTKTKTKADSKAEEPEEVINYEPDHLVVAREHDYRISPHDTVITVTTVATTIVDTYYIQVHVENMKFASTANAILSGMSPNNKFGLDERCMDPSSSIFFELVKSTDDKYAGENKDVLCAVFNTFGKIPEADSELFVTFSVIDTGGNIQQRTFPLNDIFKSEDAIERHWLLIEDTWELEEPVNPGGSGSGGFNPEVSEWENQNADINL